MSIAYIADTGVCIRCGGPDRNKYQRLRRAVRQGGVSLRISQRVFEELGGDPTADVYPSGTTPISNGLEEGWILVADDLDYRNPIVSTVMDEARRVIANETDRDEDRIEKTDTALVGLGAQLLDTEDITGVVLLTTDKPAGRAAESLLTRHGFSDRIEYRYVSEEYLETITAAELRQETFDSRST